MLCRCYSLACVEKFGSCCCSYVEGEEKHSLCKCGNPTADPNEFNATPLGALLHEFSLLSQFSFLSHPSLFTAQTTCWCLSVICLFLFFVDWKLLLVEKFILQQAVCCIFRRWFLHTQMKCPVTLLNTHSIQYCYFSRILKLCTHTWNSLLLAVHGRECRAGRMGREWKQEVSLVVLSSKGIQQQPILKYENDCKLTNILWDMETKQLTMNS